MSCGKSRRKPEGVILLLLVYLALFVFPFKSDWHLPPWHISLFIYCINKKIRGPFTEAENERHFFINVCHFFFNLYSFLHSYDLREMLCPPALAHFSPLPQEGLVDKWEKHNLNFSSRLSIFLIKDYGESLSHWGSSLAQKSNLSTLQPYLSTFYEVPFLATCRQLIAYFLRIHCKIQEPLMEYSTSAPLPYDWNLVSKVCIVLQLSLP